MKTVLLRDFESNPLLLKEVVEVLRKGGLVCIPAPSGYKLAADLGSAEAVTTVLQAKRRVGHAPGLVFLPDAGWMDKVAENVSEPARRLMRAFWPGAVTLLVPASQDLDPKVRKALTKAKGWLGVRVPDDPFCLTVVRTFGRPLLVSSANLAAKHGANSLAQVKKNFGHSLELLVDAGDIPQAPKSTLVDVTGPNPKVVRVGTVPEERVLAVVAG